METYIYIFIYLIIEALIIWIWEWRERVHGERNGLKKKRTISWVKRRLLKMKERRRQRIRKGAHLFCQRRILLSYVLYVQKVKLDEAAAQERLVHENELNHDLVTTKECGNPWDNSKSSTSVTFITSSDLSVKESGDYVMTYNLTRDVTQDELVAGEINGWDLVADDVKATMDDILSIVCETSSSKEEIMDKDPVIGDVKTTMNNILSTMCETSATEEPLNNESVSEDVKAIIDHILSIVCETFHNTAADKTNADDVYPKVVKKKIKKVEADETVVVDSKIQPEVIIPESLNRPFLFDPELSANIVTKRPVPLQLIKWNDFDDVTVDDDVLTGKDGQSWDCEDMFEYNEIHFGYKSSLDKDLSEYTTPLIREDTEQDRLRWERACRLAEEIKTKRLADQATQVSKKKKRNKKGKKVNS